MNPNHYCGCERGDDCTKTTMCYVQNVEQDLSDELETATTENSELKRSGLKVWEYWLKHDMPMTPEICTLRALVSGSQQ